MGHRRFSAVEWGIWEGPDLELPLCSLEPGSGDGKLSYAAGWGLERTFIKGISELARI